MELVGERWALLIVRDLLVGPKRFTDLRRGLPGIPTNILSARLKELEETGIVRRKVLPRPVGSIVYELTEYGAELEEIVLAFGPWGARTLGEPGRDEVITADSMITALPSTFRPEAARGLRAGYELRLAGFVIYARVQDRRLETGKGPLPDADLVIEGGPALRALMASEVGPDEAIATESVRLTGDPALLDRFAEVFHIPARPEARSA
jgi:DNA-binding HxlR family transcriptional regulator